MSLRKQRRALVAKNVRVAAMMRKCQDIEPDAKLLRANFPAVFEQAFGNKQLTKEVYGPK